MRYVVGVVLAFFGFVSVPCASEIPDDTSPLRPTHTYSIVARDPVSGELGVAVQSHWFSVGTLVPWAEAGVGAVATQSFVDVRYGISGLDLMRSGWRAQRALAALKQADPHAEIRQVAMIDAQGNVAAHTGDKCIRYAGHLTGENFSVQANLMLRDRVWETMATAYRQTSGDLAHRLLTALEAAQATGGDLRGKQSAAVLVVRAIPTGRRWEDRIVDLHVTDHTDPLSELRRLMRLSKAYRHMHQAELAFEQNRIEAALAEYRMAQTLAPENLEMNFWMAVSLVNAKRVQTALPMFKSIFQKDGNWRLLIPRLAEVDLLPSDPIVIEQITSVIPAR